MPQSARNNVADPKGIRNKNKTESKKTKLKREQKRTYHRVKQSEALLLFCKGKSGLVFIHRLHPTLLGLRLRVRCHCRVRVRLLLLVLDHRGRGFHFLQACGAE